MKPILILLLAAMPAFSQFTSAHSIWSRPIDSAAPTDGYALTWSASQAKWTFSGATAAYSCTVTAVSSIACTHNLSTSQPWVVCFDASGNELGGATATTSVTDIVATSANVATLTFSGTTTGVCKISTGSQGPAGATGATGATGASGIGTLTGDVSNSGQAVTIAANAVTSSKSAVVNTRRVCNIVIGADNGSALATADIAPQGRQCFVPAASHIVEIDVAADAGTPAVVVAVNHAGSLTSLNASLATASSGGLACVNVAGSGTGIDGATTCGAALSATTAAAGDWFETRTSASASTAKRMSIAIIYTID